MTALTDSTTPITTTTAVSNLTFCSPNITQALSNNLSAKKLIENYPLQHDFKEEFIDTLHSKNLLDTNYQLVLERITTQFPNLDVEEIKAIVDMLIKPRLINIYADKEKTRIAAIASFSWIELFRYLKMGVPDIASIELFGSRLPSFLVKTIQKVAQTLTQDPNYQLPPKLLNHFLGTPADTDYLITLPLSTPQRFEEFKDIFAHFIAQKACLNNPSFPFNDMKNYVTEYSFFKRNVPKAAYANMFALFSLKEADTQEVSEFVVSQKQNEFALLQDDFSLPLDAIIEAFPEHIFTNMQQPSSTTQELLNAEKEAIFEKIQNNAFELPKIQSREDKLWQVAFDLLVGHLSAPKNSSESSQRIRRVLLKYSIGKCSINKELESLTIGKLKITADNWPANQCSLPRNLDAKLTDLVADPSKDTQANKVAAIIAYELERYFHTHSLGFNALISMLWHCSTMLQREKLENAIIPLWDNMHGCICNLRPKKDMRNFHTFSLWETISQIMDEATSPEHFENLQNLLQQNVFFSRVSLDVDFTLDQGILSFKISEDNYSLRLPVSQSKVPDITQLSPSFEPLITPKLPESHIPYLASQVIGKGSFQSKMTALKILHSYTDESKQEAWKIIKANMLKLIGHTKDPEEILLLMKTALKCHLKEEEYCDLLLSSCDKNTSPYLMWAHILLSLSDKKADTDITTAYHLWAKYREKDPMARNFPFEWAMIKKMASYKPHLAIPLLYSLEETGYQNDEQAEIFAWLQLLLTDNSFEREKFLSLIPAETQLSFIDFFVVKNSRDLNFLLDLRASLSDTYETQTLNLIDQKLISFALDEKEIDNIDFKPLADICALAIKANLLPEAETIILKLLKNKDTDNVTLANLVIDYFREAHHEEDVQKLLDQHLIEKLFFQIPEKAIPALLHVLQLKDVKTSSSTTKTVLRLYLQVCHESKALNIHYVPCLSTVQAVLNEEGRLASALKKSIENCQQQLLDTALKENAANYVDFCSLFFTFLKRQISTNITEKHIIKIGQHLDNEEIAKKFIAHKELIISIYKPAAHFDLETIYQHQFKKDLISYLSVPTKNVLKKLCTFMKKHTYDIQKTLDDNCFLKELPGEKIQEMLDIVAQNIYESRSILKSNAQELEGTPKTIALAVKIWKDFKEIFYKLHPQFQKDYDNDDLLMETLNDFNDSTSLAIESLCKSLSLELLQDKKFLSSQIAAIKEMNEDQYGSYLFSLVRAFNEKLAAAEESQHNEWYKILIQLLSELTLKQGIKLGLAFCFESKQCPSKAPGAAEISATAALLILEELFKRPIPKNGREEEELMADAGVTILTKLLQEYPKQLNSRIFYLLSVIKKFVNYNCASRFLAIIIFESETFPEDIVKAFFAIESPHHDLIDKHLQLLHEVSFLNPNTSGILMRYVNALSWIGEKILDHTLTLEQTNFFITTIALAFANFGDSCFDEPEDVYEEYLKIARKFLQNPRLVGITYQGTNNLALGLPYNTQSWVGIDDVTGEHFYMTSSNIQKVIDEKINLLLEESVNPIDPSCPWGYVKFRQAAAILENGFNDYFKNRYSEYLSFVERLAALALLYVDQKHLFTKMVTIVAKLYLVDDQALTTDEKNLRGISLFRWCIRLKKLQQSPTVIIAEARKKGITIIDS